MNNNMEKKNRTTPYDLVTILGPTACGKTALAVRTAAMLGTGVLSADSRQVYRRMDLGTGKDLADYRVDGRDVPYYLIDVVEPGTKYNVFEYQRDFRTVYEQLHARGEVPPVVCGGSGLYLESVLRGYRLLPVPENAALRRTLEGLSLEELKRRLATYKTLHNTTDVDTPKRAIRAIEIEAYYQTLPVEERSFPALRSLNIGLSVDRETRWERIGKRLRQRLNEGMIDEVRHLLAEGIAPEDLIYYGLEYKYLTLYVTGRMGYDEMVDGLETAIRQFSKRQMTWFRGMERRGVTIHWMDATLPMDEKCDRIAKLLERDGTA